MGLLFVNIRLSSSLTICVLSGLLPSWSVLESLITHSVAPIGHLKLKLHKFDLDCINRFMAWFKFAKFL